MFIKDLYQDILGSAGGVHLNLMTLVKLFWNNSFIRVMVFLKNFMVNGRMRNSYRRNKKMNQNMFFPKSIVVEPTFKCNLECKNCYIPKDDYIMPTELFDKFVIQAERVGVFRFEIMGGEPTLKEVRKNLIPVIKKHKRSYFSICTNCTQFDDELIRDLKPLKNLAIVVSSEGTKDLTDKRRGEGVYDKFDAALRRLKKERMMFVLSLTFNLESWEQQLTDEVFRHYTKNNGFVVYTHLVVDNQKDDKHQGSIDRVRLLKQLQYLNKKYNVWMADGIFGKVVNQGVIPRDFFQVCVDPRGNVRPFRFYQQPVIGNIEKTDLRDILHSEELKKIKDMKRRESNHYLDDVRDELKAKRFKVFGFSRHYDRA